MSIETIHEKLKLARKLSDLDIGLLDTRVRAGMEGKIRAAQSDLVTLEADYKKTVVDNSVIIALQGKFGENFAEIARDKFKVVAIDFLKIVDIVGDSMISRGCGERYGSREHLMVMDELNMVKINYGIASLPVFQALYDGIGSNDSIKDAIRKQFTSQYGSQLFSAITRGEIGKSALSLDFNGKQLPVALYNYTLPLDSSFLPNPAEVVMVSEKPTAANVKKTLLGIKNKVS